MLKKMASTLSTSVGNISSAMLQTATETLRMALMRFSQTVFEISINLRNVLNSSVSNRCNLVRTSVSRILVAARTKAFMIGLCLLRRHAAYSSLLGVLTSLEEILRRTVAAGVVIMGLFAHDGGVSNRIVRALFRMEALKKMRGSLFGRGSLRDVLAIYIWTMALGRCRRA